MKPKSAHLMMVLRCDPLARRDRCGFGAAGARAMTRVVLVMILVEMMATTLIGTAILLASSALPFRGGSP
jgi:hypothetical protein